MQNASRTKIVPRLMAALLATAALGTAGSASALGLGNVVAKSAVGAPFQAELELFVADNREADTILVKSARSEVYDRQGVRYTSLVGSLNVRVVERGGRYYAQLSSPQSVSEPVVTVILEGTTYSGMIRRTYDVPLAVPMERGPKAPGAEQAAIEAEKEAQAKAVAKAAKKARQVQYVLEKGERPQDIGRITASGENEPLPTALSKIVPTGWRGFAIDPTVKTAQPVTWSATDKPWTEVLREVISTRGVRAHINWSKKEVEFSASPQVTLALADDEEEVTLAGNDDKAGAITGEDGGAVAAEPPLGVVAPAAVAQVKQETVAALRSIQVKGQGVIAERTISSFGVNVGLLAAIAQIVPDGWSVVSRDGAVNNTRLVGWNGHDRSWLAVFDEIMSKYSFTAKLDSERREIEIFRT